MIRPTGEYTELEARLLDLSMILHAEHGGGNNSSFTTHLISSTGTDTYSAIAAAIGSLKGPKHGGANIAVINMMNDLRKNVPDFNNRGKLDDYLVKVLRKEANDKSGLVYGMGHAIYTLSDPRAKVLKSMAKKLARARIWLTTSFSVITSNEELRSFMRKSMASKTDAGQCRPVFRFRI